MAVARCCWRRLVTGFSAGINVKPALLKDVGDSFHHLETILMVQSRSGSYRASKQLEDLTDIPDYEVCRSPPEWKYVESLLPPRTVPAPILKEEYPSGWKPQSPDCKNDPFYVARTKNHMVPVYILTTHRGMRKVTRIRNVKGDIWGLDLELKTFLAKKYARFVPTRVHELCGNIDIKGDYALDTEKFLLDRGM